MSLTTTRDAQRFEAHGSAFRSYVAPRTGSTQLCAWELQVSPGLAGQPHTVSHEEVLRVLEGRLQFTVDGEVYDAAPGDVVRFPAGATVCVDNLHDEPAAAWVTTSVGLTAELTDGTQLSPPWTH